MVRWIDRETSDKARDWIINELSKLEPSLFQTDRTDEGHTDLDDLPF